jgi:hypothetical protein
MFAGENALTIFDVLHRLVTQPGETLIRNWNWKSSMFSSVLRALVFLCANLTAGWRAASGAMLAEFIYRGISAGFYGAITQAFRKAEPAWAAGVAVMILLPLVSHVLELAIHLTRGTPKIITSVIASVCFTVVSTLFHFYAVRQGALLVESGAESLGADMKRLPRLIAGFAGSVPVLLQRRTAKRSSISPRGPVGDLR